MRSAQFIPHYLSSEHIRAIASVDGSKGSGITEVRTSDDHTYTVPVSPETLIALMEEHGYKFIDSQHLNQLEEEFKAQKLEP